MLLLDDARRVVDANGAYLQLVRYPREEIIDQPMYRFVVDGPAASPAEWKAALQAADGSTVAVQWAGTVEVVTGRQLILFVALSTSRWGPRFRRTVAPEQAPQALSERERQIVRLVALGNTGPEIADELRIAHDTVRTHARNAMAKVGARSRAHLVAKALGEGLALD